MIYSLQSRALRIFKIPYRMQNRMIIVLILV